MNPFYGNLETAPVLTVSRATLLCRDGLVGGAYKVLHVRDLEIRNEAYAQYERALIATFTVKGSRRRVSLVDTFAPSLIVLDGWIDPSVPDTYGPEQDRGNGVVVKTARGLSLAPMWTTEARAAAQATGKILADYHEHDAGGRSYAA